ncbi:MAG: HAMP domain-containing sensor histidine kinase [Gemmatimonadota bacterium]
MIPPRTLRGRLFLVLFAVALVPVALGVLSGALLLREFVVSTGTAGAWDQVAESGRLLLEAVEGVAQPSDELTAAAAQHRAELGESVRFSRLYSFLGEQMLVLLPVVVLVTFLVAGTVALVSAGWLARSFSQPVEEVVRWTELLGAGQPLPPPDSPAELDSLWEFVAVRDALRATEAALAEARLREAERIRTQSWTEMARRVAHELKNPLTPMGMAAKAVAAAEDPRIASAGEVLRDEIRRLDALARSFAQFGRPVEGPPSLVDLVELCTSVARRLSTPEAPIEIGTPSGSLAVMGHLDALERVVRNLLANAQEATSAEQGEGHSVDSVELHLARSSSGVEIRVLDRGPGIPAELLPHIWEPEFTTKRRGTGLGLALVRQAIRAHGGAVSAENRAGGGAEFRVWLPDVSPGAASEPPESTVPRGRERG